MRDLKISLIHASYQSRGQSKKTRDTWFKKSANPLRIEHCLGFEYSDLQVREEYSLPRWEKAGLTIDGMTRFATTIDLNSPSAVRNWNAAAAISTGDILFVISDDTIPDYGWDLLINNLVVSLNYRKALFVVSDTRCSESIANHGADDLLPRHPIVTRQLYEQYEYIFNPKYMSVGCDNEWLLESLQSGVLEDARAIRLHHSHGRLFDSRGFLKCGCETSTEPLSTSQIRMRDTKVQKEANLQLDQWGFWWRLIEFYASLPSLANYVFRAYIKSRNRGKLRPTQILIFVCIFIAQENVGKLVRKLPVLALEFGWGYLRRRKPQRQFS